MLSRFFLPALLATAALVPAAEPAGTIAWRFKAGETFYTRHVNFVETGSGLKKKPLMTMRHDWLYRVDVREVAPDGSATLQVTYEDYVLDAAEQGKTYHYSYPPTTETLSDHMVAELKFPVAKRQAQREGKKEVLRVSPTGKVLAYIQHVDAPAPLPPLPMEIDPDSEPFDPQNTPAPAPEAAPSAGGAPAYWLFPLPGKSAAELKKRWLDPTPWQGHFADAAGLEFEGRRYRTEEPAKGDSTDLLRVEFEDVYKRARKKGKAGREVQTREASNTGWLLFDPAAGRPKKVENVSEVEMDVRNRKKKVRVAMRVTSRFETLTERPAPK